MQQSNGYIIGFAAALTIVLGGLLSLAAVGLKEKQREAVALETKKQILSAVMPTEGTEKQELAKVYDQRIKSVVVNYDGEIVETDAEGNAVVPENVSIAKEYKKPKEDRHYPVFMFTSENDPEKVDAYILPVYGFGLWDYIWGYVALDGNFNTIAGVTFDHKGETPGLGARITDAEVQQRFQGKELYDNGGEFVSVKMLKGETSSNLGPHTVNGLSGATITANGVSEMIYQYMQNYNAYMEKSKKAS